MVLDTNQYASALLKPESNSARLIALAAEGHITLIISQDILAEIRRVLAYPKLQKLHGGPEEEIEQFIRKTEKIAIVTPGELAIDVITADCSDNIILACAVEGNADCIVSGDHHLKDLGAFQGIDILDAAAFLEILET
ncbi:putative toxin-antitoxin system toxin component, PIN family [Desulforhabdus sp. TSK]|uniref:putative toxin-antitoxin system toxin component, PIN family n=1 Tax=Desulforhabdus sp. TSK TaxID=2925014 RepID=UPI001FC8D5EC|nr:putative toxin-antitoxin system toxin component, PIN family [Desulforhabdus sp. TSK]